MPPPTISFRLCPAQKCLPAALIIMTLTDSSVDTPDNASIISPIICLDKALIFSGRFNVKNAISPSVENSISLYSMLFCLL